MKSDSGLVVPFRFTAQIENGQMELIYPSEISPEDAPFVLAWWELMTKKISRAMNCEPARPRNPQPPESHE